MKHQQSLLTACTWPGTLNTDLNWTDFSTSEKGWLFSALKQIFCYVKQISKILTVLFFSSPHNAP